MTDCALVGLVHALLDFEAERYKSETYSGKVMADTKANMVIEDFTKEIIPERREWFVLGFTHYYTGRKK